MAIYQQLTCSSCLHVLQHWEGKWIAIGCPLINCPKCGTSLRHPNVNEWESLDALQRIGHLWTHLYTSCLYGLGIFVVSYFILTEWLGLSKDTVNPISFAAATLMFIVRAVFLAKEIYLSKQRLRDPEYRQRLGRRGLVKIK